MIPPTTIAASLRSSADFPGGPTFGLLCQAIANALVAWLPTGTALVGVTTGVVGAGVVNGTVTFAGVPSVVLAAMAGNGFNGQTAPRLARVLSTGLNAALNGLTYAGVSTGVSSGTDVSHVTTVNVPALATAIQAAHASLCSPLGGHGATQPSFYTGLAGGIGSIIQTGVTLTPSGVVTPSGPVGVGATVGTSLSTFV